MDKGRIAAAVQWFLIATGHCSLEQGQQKRMRLPVILASAIATVATMALAACANRSGMVPSSPSAMAPTTAQNHTSADDAASTQDSLALKTCATSPPQYQWIFKGACQTFDLTSTGGHFSLSEYRGITVNGLIGRNSAKGAVEIALADDSTKTATSKCIRAKPSRRTRRTAQRTSKRLGGQSEHPIDHADYGEGQADIPVRDHRCQGFRRCQHLRFCLAHLQSRQAPRGARSPKAAV